MRGLMMDYQLSIPAIIRRAETLFKAKTVTSRRPDRKVVKHSYAEVLDRARRLAVALVELGVRPGDRVATLAWAGHQHLEAYLAIPSIGGVLHTLNLRLHHDELAFIVNDADDRVLILDESLVPLFEKFRAQVKVERLLVITCPDAGEAVREEDRPRLEGYLDYEETLAAADPSRYVEPAIDERDAAAMCYTSGTTGRPKGVLYSHRAIILHSLTQGLRDALSLGEDDTVLPIVPMFHVNAWGLPFSCTMAGASQVFCDRFLEPDRLIDLLDSENVTIAAGVPTIWLGMLATLERTGQRLPRLLRILSGGAATPASLIEGYDKLGIDVQHAWGMTETSSIATVSKLPFAKQDAPYEEQLALRARQGPILPPLDARIVEVETGIEQPWDGVAVGELQVRGATVTGDYNSVQAGDRFDNGWLRTGDVATIDANGFIQIVDRTRDLIKSGGEWISSVDLENAIMAHPFVLEAAVVGLPHPRWQERPVAAVALKPDTVCTREEIRDFLGTRMARWQLPDEVVFMEAIPRTSVGKFAKNELRELLAYIAEAWVKG